MPRRNGRVPSYRKHKASGQAVVTIAGKDHYLGRYGAKISKLEYDRIVCEWLAAGCPVSAPEQCELTILELLARYLKFARGYYRKGGKRTDEYANICDSLKPLKRLYASLPAAEFGPTAYKAVRQTMIDADLSRTTINGRVGRIKRMFRWAAGEELVPPSVPQALSMVAGLKKGRCEAREATPIQNVPDGAIQRVLPHLPEVVADMVQIQRLTGCRPGEVCILRPCDVDRSGEVWAYRPRSHKTEHHERERIVFLGPKAQGILRPYLLRPSDSYCFSPADSERKRLAERHASRKTPANQGNGPGMNRKSKRRRCPGDRYDVSSYRRAIHRACDLAGEARWNPNRLRHSAATEVRRRFGLEAAQVVLGHAQANVTQIYAQRDAELAQKVAMGIG